MRIARIPAALTLPTLTFAALTLAALAAAPVAGQAKPGQQVKEEHGWPVDMDGSIRIHNYNGTVTVTGWEKDSVAVFAVIAGKPSPSGRPLIFGGGGRKGVKMGVDNSDDFNQPLTDMTVFVPSRARLSIRGAATSVDVKNFAGSLDASTLSGRLRIAGPMTEITAETMDGDLEVDASPSFFRGRTATGRLTWNGSSDDVTLNTVSGAVVINGSTLLRARIESISGDIKFAGTVKPNGRVGFDSHAGDVTIAFAKDARAELGVDAPTATLLGVPYGRAKGASGMHYIGVPRGVLAGAARPAEVTARSFKGKVTVTQP